MTAKTTIDMGVGTLIGIFFYLLQSNQIENHSYAEVKSHAGMSPLKQK